MQFQRRTDVPIFANYQDYRPYLREDFLCHCAYCTTHEDELIGEENFEIDHYKPRSKFAELINIYENLYYVCHGCNRRGAKGENWPSQDLLDEGYRFFDPIVENAYELHMRESRSGKLIAKTRVGEYSIDKLRLNREGLVKLRRRRKEMRKMLRNTLIILSSFLKDYKKKNQIPPPEFMARIELIHQSLHKRPVLGLLPEWWN